MLRKQTMYCLGCGHLISIDKANRAFRTGFYRAIYPLALCIDCAKKDEQREEELVDPMKSQYSDNTLS